jgi:hypothetical protein
MVMFVITISIKRKDAFVKRPDMDFQSDEKISFYEFVTTAKVCVKEEQLCGRMILTGCLAPWICFVPG